MSAAKTKAQAIIDENPVGMSCSLHLLYERQTDILSSRFLKVVLPLLQGRKDPPVRHGRQVLCH